MASMTQSVASGSGMRPEVGAPEKRPSTRRDSAETLAGSAAVYDLPKAQSSDIPAHLQASFAEQERGAEYYDTYPNEWSRIRKYIQEPAAEMLGTFLLVLIGVSTACQVGLSANPAVSSMPLGIFMSIPVGFGLGQACGVWVSIGISGGHINPAVTIAMAVFRGFSWRKVPGYIFGQVLGAFIAALCIYGNYFHAIDIVEGGRSIRTVPGTASLFTGYAAPYTTDINCFFNEVLCSFILIFIIFAVTDPRNAAPPAYFIPVTLFAAIFAIASGLALNTGATVNPARDLGPRLMTAIVGYGEGVWGFRRQFWLWCNWCGPIVGGLIAGGLYDTLLYTGKGLVNRKSRAARRFELEQFVRRRMQEVPEPRSMV